MKRGISILSSTLLLFFLMNSCIDKEDIPLPDLDPSTSGGGEIVTYDVGFLIPIVTTGESELVEQFSGYGPFEIDLGNDGGPWDFRLSSTRENSLIPGQYLSSTLRIQFTGEILMRPTAYIPVIQPAEYYAQFLPANALIGGTIEGLWASPRQAVEMISTGFGEWIGGNPILLVQYPSGLSYLPTRTKVGADYYYGWLEFLATDVEDDDHDDWLLITRFGISSTPGLRIRMGQE